MTVEFGLLGEIEARICGQRVDLGHTRQRLVLAALLVDVNRAVLVGQLVDRVWGEAPPQRARATLYSYLSRLRQALAAADGVTFTRRSGSYVLTADTQAVDLYRFRHLVAQARATDEDEPAAALFDQALRLWRGESFASMDMPWINALRAILDQERLAAELDRNDLRLRCGRHAELLGELRSRADEHPLDERLAAQVMLALYRCGRSADALGRYQQIRLRLAEELGIDPGPALHRLHQQILTGDPALASDTAAARGRGVASRRSAGPVPVPRQLPAPPALFTGRENELAELSAALHGHGHTDRGGTVVISAIGGTGGIGKTWLALRWAHDHLGHFPDGQLYVNLRGFDPAGQPVEPPTAVRAFLDALGVQPAAIPSDPDAQAALYRSLVAERRMLIVLDNARDTAQVSTLLPGSPSCTVLVTSRRQLGGLVTTHAARQLALDTLTETEARQLLTGHLGPTRVAAEPGAVTAILDRCAGLPLALGIVAARAAAQPDFPLAGLAEELREAVTRLDALDAGDLTANLRAVFDSSYDALDAPEAEVFGLLGLAPGPDISLHATASLTGHTLRRTRALLRRLQVTHLIHQPTPGRYRFHDLVRLYAAERGEHDQPEATRTAALRRLVDFYLHTGHHASRLIEPHPPITIELEQPAAGCTPHRLADSAAAEQWCATEALCLLGAQQLADQRGWDTLVWQLPWALCSFRSSTWYQGRFRDDLMPWRAGLAAAERHSDPTPRALAHLILGQACWQVERQAEGLDHLGHALSLFEETGNTPGQAYAHQILGCVWDQGGDPQRALPHGERALLLYRAVGNTVWEAIMLNNVGWYHALLGDYERAHVHCEQALTLCRKNGSHNGEAATLDSLGYIARQAGQHALALDYCRQSVTLCRESGSVYYQADALENLGAIHHALGQIAEARDAWQQALDLYRAQHRPAKAERIQDQLDALDDT